MNERKVEAAEEKKAESPRAAERLSESEGLAEVEIEFEDDPEDFGDDTELVPLADELKKNIFGDNKCKTEEEQLLAHP